MTTMSAGQAIGTRKQQQGADSESNLYIPHPIADRVFSFKDSTMAAGEKASIELVRFDESVRKHPYLRSIRKALMHIECMATVRSDGVDPDPMLLLHFELARSLEKSTPHEQKRYIYKKFPAVPPASIEASYEAFRCLQALELIDAYTPREDGFTLDEIWALYDTFIRGTKRERMGGMRSSDEQEHFTSVNSGVLYIPPKSDRLPELMEDFVDFCNRDSISAFTRSTVEHFQIEALKPVDEGLDRWGRMIALLIWKQSGMMDNIIPPFSLTPAVQTKTHTELLIPYKTGQAFSKRSAMDALDSWVAHCAQATMRGVIYGRICCEDIEHLQEGWRNRLGGVTVGSALDTLLIELAGSPLITVPLAAELTGKRFQGASELIDKLVKHEVLEPLTEGRRNRIFVAREAYDWLNNTSHHLFAEKAVAREAFFK